MKKFALILLTMAVVACSNNKTEDEDHLRETARKDIVEKMDLPEGTIFDDKSMEVTRNPENEDGPNVEYIVKVTVKSQNQDGKEIEKVHRMHYRKKADAEAAKDRFELQTID